MERCTRIGSLDRCGEPGLVIRAVGDHHPVAAAFEESNADDAFGGRRRQVVRHADVAPHMAVAGDQHHSHAGRCGSHRHRQRRVTGPLRQSHRRDHRRRQRAAVAGIDLVAQFGVLGGCPGRWQCGASGIGRGQPALQVHWRLRHATSHHTAGFGAAQVATDHAGATGQRRIEQRAVQRPAPAFLVELTGTDHRLGVARRGGDRGVVLAVDLLEHDPGRPAIGQQPAQQGGTQPVLRGVVVDFAQQHIARGAQALGQRGDIDRPAGGVKGGVTRRITRRG